METQKLDVKNVNQSIIKGRIEEIADNEGTFYTRLALPSADEYSSVQTVEIRSDQRLGTRGEVVEVPVKVGGYGRGFNRRDGSKAIATTVTLHAVN